jgi:tetratricopeptide (TPR) repeat protein
VTLPGGVTVLQVRLPAGGKTASGLLLDRDGRLVATILPPSPQHADRLIAAVALGGLDSMADGDDSGIRLSEVQKSERRFSSDMPTALMGRALAADRGGIGDALVKLLDRIEQVTGPFAALYLERGAVYFEAGRIARAAVEFQTAITAAPETHLAHYNLGITLGAGGLYDEAATVFRRALEIAPEHPRTHYQLALALTAAHRLPEAREEHRLLSHLDPSLAADLQGLIGF